MRLTYLIIHFILSLTAIQAESGKRELVRFRPITREEYNEILKLTDGKPTISEGRLITSGLALSAYKSLITLTSGFWPNVLSVFGISQTPVVDDDLDDEQSYPLCVVQDEKQAQQSHITNNALDCIIVVRDPEDGSEESFEPEYYDNNEPVNIMPGYQQWPYAALHSAPQTPMHQTPPYPYFALPYSYANPHQFYPLYPAFGGFVSPLHGTPQSVEAMQAQSQHQAQFQTDLFNHGAFPSYPLPFYPHVQPTAPPTNNNINNGPVVHVIRGDKRDLSNQNRLKTKRRSSPHKQKVANRKRETRTHRKVSERFDDGNKKKYSAKPNYRSAYSRVSLMRPENYKPGPIYVRDYDSFY